VSRRNEHSAPTCHRERSAKRAVERRVLAIACALVLLGAAPPTESQRLQTVVNAAAASAKANLGARFGITVWDWTTGARASANGDQRFPLASTFKVPLALAVLEKVDAGTLALNKVVRVEAQDIVPYASSVAKEYAKGRRTYRIDELLERMVRDSDNTAADTLFRTVGGASVVNRALAGAGVTQIVIRTDEAGLHRDFVAGRNFAHGGDNAGTPNAYAKLLVGLLLAPKGHRPLSASTAAPLYWAMLSSQTGSGRLRAGLPTKTALAHKTGTSGRSADGAVDATNDAGLVTLDDGKRNIVIVAFLNGARGTDDQNDAAIAALARAVVGAAR
jgi:beta-lactamase class A